jgi:hypothetical protein
MAYLPEDLQPFRLIALKEFARRKCPRNFGPKRLDLINHTTQGKRKLWFRVWSAI